MRESTTSRIIIIITKITIAFAKETGLATYDSFKVKGDKGALVVVQIIKFEDTCQKCSKVA